MKSYLTFGNLGRLLFAAVIGVLYMHGIVSPEVAMAGALVGNVTDDTLKLMKGALATGDDNIAKTVNQATGLVAYDLQGPAKNLYPVNTPIRNRIPRVGGGVGTATNWKAIRAIVGSGFDSMGWVAEGQRTARMSYSAVDVAASYRTIGEEDQVTFEAVSAGRTFEDVRSTASMRVLQKMMLKEENALLLGNASVALGTPTAPTVSASGTGATLAAATYVVIVVALTGEGFRGASLANGVPLSSTITGADGQTYTLNGGSSVKSAGSSGQAVTLGQTLFASTPAINGAMGYAWFVGTSGNEKLEKITTINSAAFTTALAGTGQAASAVTAGDKSVNSLGFNGLIYSALASGSGAYVNTLATGTAGTGTALTASTRGTITEIDVMLRSMWDNYQVSPTVIYVNAQELDNISKKALTGPGSNALLQIFTDPASGYQGMMAGGVVGWYFNPFAMEGMRIPIKIHPTLPAGTIIGWCENLPMQYQSNNVPNVAEVKVRQDYYQIDWPLRTRAHEFGVYAEEVLAVYAPFAMGVINNIANG